MKRAIAVPIVSGLRPGAYTGKALWEEDDGGAGLAIGIQSAIVRGRRD